MIFRTALAYFRLFLALMATVFWCSLALVLRPFWKRSVIVLQPYWARTLLFLVGVKVNVRCDATISPPVIYVANHQSGLDILVMIAHMPDSVRFVAKKELANVPFTGWCMRAADYLFIDRDNPGGAREKLRQAGAEIRSGGRSVIMFPEGTRYPLGHLGPFKSGAFYLALAAETTLVPVGITNTGELMERKGLLCYSGSVNINIGPLINTSQWVGREQQLRDYVRDEVRRLAGKSAALDSVSS